jgi:iron complex outermembrane receptor protein
MQIDFTSPDILTLVTTINAENPVDISGLEFDFTLMPLPNLTFGLSYTYLDEDMPLQPNPLANGALRKFVVTLSPKHAGALTLDYRFNPLPIGTLNAHFDATSTAHYAYEPFGEQRTDSYTLLNARLELTDIAYGQQGAFTLSVWGKNLTDEEYIISAFPVGDPAVSIGQAFGDPRTAGIDIKYEY